MKNANRLAVIVLFFSLFFINPGIITNNSNDESIVVKAEFLLAHADDIPNGEKACITDNQEPGIVCYDNNCSCPNDRTGCQSILME